MRQSVRPGFEEADQICGCSRPLDRTRWQGSGAEHPQKIPVMDGGEGRLRRTFNRPMQFTDADLLSIGA